MPAEKTRAATARKSVVLLGPIAPPQWGPAVKNRILLDALTARGVAVVPVNTLGWSGRPLRFLAQALRQCLRTRRVILAVSARGRFAFLPLLHMLALVSPLKVALLPAGGLFAAQLETLPGVLRRLYLHWCARCSMIMVETERLAADLRRLGLHNVEVLPNFKPAWPGTRATAPYRNKPALVYLSRVRPQKGIEVLLTALDRLQLEGLDFDLDVYGILLDDYRQPFERLVAERAYVRYGGALDPSEVVPRIAVYDLMVFPTLCASEGFPGVLVDAAMAGLPVVATDIAYNSEIIRDGFNGLLAKPGDPDDLAVKIRLLIQDGSARRRMGANNRQTSQRYSVDHVIGEFLAQLEQAGWWGEE